LSFTDHPLIWWYASEVLKALVNKHEINEISSELKNCRFLLLYPVKEAVGKKACKCKWWYTKTLSL
jgi:hypothetical protein